MTKTQDEFNAGDFVVYPSHGVGKIQGLETHNIAGQEVTLYAISFERERMTLKVPQSKAKTAGLRKLSSKKHMESVVKTLQAKAKAKKTVWSQRAQEYESKINSGDLVQLAEVVRDLHPKSEDHEQSFSEKQMYQSAFERLSREMAAVDDLGEQQAHTKLLEILVEKKAA